MQVQQLVNTLGGKKVIGVTIKTDFDVVDIIKSGLNLKVIDYFISENVLTRKEIEDLIIPRSTLAFRKKHKMSLTLEESEHIVRIARIVTQAMETFTNFEKTTHWLRRPNKSLKNRIPLAMLDTEEGARIVEVTLGQIAYGIFA